MVKSFHLFILLAFLSLTSRNSEASLCVLSIEGDRPLHQLLSNAISRGCSEIVVPEQTWTLDGPFLLEDQTSELRIRGAGTDTILSGREPLLIVRRSKNISFQNLTFEGTVELEQTENIRFSEILFKHGGIRFPGRKCNQPNECTGFNRRIVVENCTFEDCEHGILAERLENSRMERNRFTGRLASCANEAVGIELDGSSEDLDRMLELGHSKGNQILHNSFEQESATGIRLRDSWGNIIRDNSFVRAHRAIELHKGARHNQILQSYIGYLSQQPVSAACQSPCGIYLGPGSVNNIFWNNFFEQNFELQFLEANRNRTYVIDESGQQNVFRSDFLR